MLWLCSHSAYQHALAFPARQQFIVQQHCCLLVTGRRDKLAGGITQLLSGVTCVSIPAQALKQAAPIVQGCGIGRLYLQGPTVVCHCFFILSKPVVTERPVVVSPAVSWVQSDCHGIVFDSRFKATLHDRAHSCQLCVASRMSGWQQTPAG